MSDTGSPNGRKDSSIPDGGILAALPRKRPQRASPRRATTPATTTKEPAGAGAGKKPVAARKRAGAVAKPTAKPTEPPAPKQGYEPEEEIETGTTVHPPSGVELVESVADILGELAGTGLTAGGRLLKDAFSVFRRP